MPTRRAFWAILTIGSSTLRPSRRIKSAKLVDDDDHVRDRLAVAAVAKALYAVMLRSMALASSS